MKAERNGEQWFAISHDLGLVGRGESDLEAVDDLRAQIAELFDSLIEMKESLGPHLLNQLKFLERLGGATE